MEFQTCGMLLQYVLYFIVLLYHIFHGVNVRSGVQNFESDIIVSHFFASDFFVVSENCVVQRCNFCFGRCKAVFYFLLLKSSSLARQPYVDPGLPQKLLSAEVSGCCFFRFHDKSLFQGGVVSPMPIIEICSAYICLCLGVCRIWIQAAIPVLTA
jgi:hypothetical protein